MGRDETAAGLPNRWKMASRPTVHCSEEMQKWKLIDIFLHGDNDFSICITCMSQGLDPSSLKSLKVLFCLKVIICLLLLLSYKLSIPIY